MAGLFDKQAEIYQQARPTYPPEWFSLFADRTTHHSRAWDAGTGNGQAAVAVADHYDQVIATDVSQAQLSFAKPHPKIKYLHTPLSMSEDELVNLIGGEGSVDLVIVATAIHYFDLDRFYNVVNRVLRKPGGLIAVWSYYKAEVSPEFDTVRNRLEETCLPFFDPRVSYVVEGYKTLPFPFEEVGLGREGRPMGAEIEKRMSFGGYLALVRSSSGVAKAAERGVDLLPEGVVRELESAWGGSDLVRTVVFKAFLLAGKVKS